MRVRQFWILVLVMLISASLACNAPSASTGQGTSTGATDQGNPTEAPAQANPTESLPPAPTEGGAPAGGGGSASGACANPLYPVVMGATWTYSMTGATPGNFTRSIVAVAADGFTDQDVFDAGTTRTGQWKCDSGALTALDPGSGGAPTANVATSAMSADFKTTAMDGVTLPANVTAGTTWSQSFTIEGTQSINGTDVQSKNQSNYNCTAGATESVTVAAGTFDALKVDCQSDMTITITMNGVDVPTNVNTTSTTWYAPGVGQVKTVTTLSDGSTSTIELVSYTIP